MKLKKFRIVLIVFVICTLSINGQEICPTGIQSIQDCSTASCPSGSICYGKDDSFFCCGALHLFCPTKMHSFHSMEEEHLSYLWGPVTSAKKDEWYNVQLESEYVACPIPFSFTYSLFEELKLLPVDFDTNNKAKSTPKTCYTNSDCNIDNEEFCGAAYHPTFHRELDGSGNDGVPLRFCYKFQNFGSTNVKPVITADEKELKGCNNNSYCSPFKGTETFCKMAEKKVRIAKNNGAIIRFMGFCAFDMKSGVLWWYVLAGSIVGTVIFLGLSATFYIFHRKSAVTTTEAAMKTEMTNKTASKETASS